MHRQEQYTLAEKLMFRSQIKKNLLASNFLVIFKNFH